MIPQYTYPAQQESFGDKARDFISFEGRIGRQTYWMRSLLLMGIYLVALVLFFAATEAGTAGILLGIAGVAIYAAMFVASLATTVKRLHDRGRSGWFMLISLIPLVGLWLLVEVGFLAGEQAPNQYGDPV
jgi:uncharacterized membrane protein YhaH (DUF805 family)